MQCLDFLLFWIVYYILFVHNATQIRFLFYVFKILTLFYIFSCIYCSIFINDGNNEIFNNFYNSGDLPTS